MKRKTALHSLFFLLLATGICMASRVFHKPLEQVVTPERPVLKATVVGSEVEILPDLLQVRVEVDHIESIHLSAPDSKVWLHSYSTLVTRRQDDGSILRVSPIREGSGLEPNLEVGKRYIFILGPGGELVRVEPLEKEATIRSLLQPLGNP